MTGSLSEPDRGFKRAPFQAPDRGLKLAPELALNPPPLPPSLSTDFSRLGGQTTGSRTTRASLFPAFGYLYPEASELLAVAEDEDAIRRCLVKAMPEYAALWGE